jgi:hypothetical protein
MAVMAVMAVSAVARPGRAAGAHVVLLAGPLRPPCPPPGGPAPVACPEVR